LMVEGQKDSAHVFWRSFCSWKNTFDSWTWRFPMTSEHLRLPAVLPSREDH
jgi:hypothetical protein